MSAKKRIYFFPLTNKNLLTLSCVLQVSTGSCSNFWAAHGANTAVPAAYECVNHGCCCRTALSEASAPQMAFWSNPAMDARFLSAVTLNKISCNEVWEAIEADKEVFHHKLPPILQKWWSVTTQHCTSVVDWWNGPNFCKTVI